MSSSKQMILFDESPVYSSKPAAQTSTVEPTLGEWNALGSHEGIAKSQFGSHLSARNHHEHSVAGSNY